MPTDSAFWRDLEAQFRALPDSGKLTAMLSGGQWHVYGSPSDERQGARLQSLFGSLARRGGFAAGRPNRRRYAASRAGRPNRPNALDAWLNLLRNESPHFHGTEDTTVVIRGVERRHRNQGWIEDLAVASAEYCADRATRAFGLEAEADGSLLYEPPAVPSVQREAEPEPGKGGSDRKAYVQPILKEKGWSIADWAAESGVDFHTANDYLKGKTNSYSSTRKKLADSLGVAVKDLPK